MKSGGTELDFEEYAQARVVRLRQRAYLLCRDWHLAQDLTQITLSRLYASWRKVVKADNIDAYAAKVMVRVFLDHKRLKSSHEVVSDTMPSASAVVDGSGGPELRLTLMEALGRLGPRARAIVVLRYWEDHSVDTVAELLGVTPSLVKTQSMRALAELRALLGTDLATLVG
ncbi:SigE family RNA polymerase sigma factor [Virgisporangium aurantiacum]|uniref:RNA polymerase sigma24 factor n=1 Tax=Virgisporangium aurantiacum TaxID=175570 RepID=A0A8J4EA96_9ACTN|nr:SigE family RNA polymerase sigma factor [Virgisporangium aurantiacum]GIJ64542.1 RNA polymerase sigma24 factor [Virgisporangium aurantiacum]